MPKLTPARLLIALLVLAVLTFALNPPALLVHPLTAVLFFLGARSLPVAMRIAMVAVMAWMAFRFWDITLCMDAGGRYVGNPVTARCEGVTLPPLAERTIGEAEWGLVAYTGAVALAAVEGVVRWVRGRESWAG